MEIHVSVFQRGKEEETPQSVYHLELCEQLELVPAVGFHLNCFDY